jgi:hypothetical protein
LTSRCALWLGTTVPERTIRWLDGALAAAAKFGVPPEPGGDRLREVVAIAAGKQAWLDLATDRATRAKIAIVATRTDLELDYLGWAQVAAALARHVGATTVLVDEASRPERFAEVGAIAELLDAAHLARVVAISFDGEAIHASRVHGRELHGVRVRGNAVIGVRVAGPVIDDYPTPLPPTSLRLVELAALGLDPNVLAHRAQPARAQGARKTVDRVLEHLAAYVAADARGAS